MAEFLKARPVAVVGASNNRGKWGNIIFRNLRALGWDVIPVHPAQREVEGVAVAPSLKECSPRPELAVLVVPPAVGLKVLDDAAESGVERIWIQPGASSPELVERAEALGLRVIDGPCIMVEAGAGHG